MILFWLFLSFFMMLSFLSVPFEVALIISPLIVFALIYPKIKSQDKK